MRVEEFIEESGLPIDRYQAYMYGYPELADQLLELVLRGDKRATTGLKPLYELEGEPLPQPGEYSVILSAAGEPRCITRITRVEVVRFRDIDEAYARTEGEGDKSLAYWKREHRKVFARECREDFGIDFSEDMECVCEYFEVVYPR